MIQLGWSRRDEEGRKIEISFELVRDKAKWTVHRARNEPREAYTPEEQDWEDLLEVINRHRARGKVTHLDAEIVERLHAKALE